MLVNDWQLDFRDAFAAYMQITYDDVMLCNVLICA